MTTYAVLDAGRIVEWRDIPDWESYPAHKKAACDEKGDGGPTLRPRAVEGQGQIEETIIERDRVLIRRSERPLDEVKAGLRSRVDADAEQVRLKFITPGHGMALTYQEKHRQAEAVDDLGQEAANALSAEERKAQFPTLSASVGIEADTLWACAQLVIQRYETFDNLAHEIERVRLLGKKAISDASDAASARAAYEAIEWTV